MHITQAIVGHRNCAPYKSSRAYLNRFFPSLKKDNEPSLSGIIQANSMISGVTK